MCDQVRVFSKAFGHPSPARVPGNVDHGGEIPVDPSTCCFPGRYSGRLSDQQWIESGSKPYVDREDGFKAMDHVPAKQQGYAVRTFFNSRFLHHADRFRSGFVQHRPDRTFPDSWHQVGGIVPAGAVQQLQLADLLVKAHFFQDGFDGIMPCISAVMVHTTVHDHG